MSNSDSSEYETLVSERRVSNAKSKPVHVLRTLEDEHAHILERNEKRQRKQERECAREAQNNPTVPEPAHLPAPDFGILSVRPVITPGPITTPLPTIPPVHPVVKLESTLPPPVPPRNPARLNAQAGPSGTQFTARTAPIQNFDFDGAYTMSAAERVKSRSHAKQSKNDEQ